MHYLRFSVCARATQTKLECILQHEVSSCPCPYPCLEGQVLFLILILVLKGQVLVHVLVLEGSVLVNITGIVVMLSIFI